MRDAFGRFCNDIRCLTTPLTFILPQLVPAVTELIVAELLYLQYTDGKRPIYMYINSTGCTRADGETVRQVASGADSAYESVRMHLGLNVHALACRGRWASRPRRPPSTTR